MKALCIIDVQEYFMKPYFKWYDKVVNNTLTLINKQKRKQHPIIIVEFNDPSYGSTIEEIVDEIGEYPYELVRKSDRSGGYQIESVVSKLACPRQVILAGVNYHQCVAATAETLLRINFTVDVYKNASNPQFATYEKDNWKSIKQNANLKFKYVKSGLRRK